MPLVAQNEPLTRYLMFKVSLISWDHDLGCQSIQHLTKSADRTKTQDILYACIREAQHVGDRLCTLAALKAMIDNFSSASSTTHLPSILRCTIRLVHTIESQQENSVREDQLVGDVCHAFEKGS